MKLPILAATLILSSAAPIAPPADPEPPAAAMPNVATERAGCRPLHQQVQDEANRNRDGEARTLDREPAGQLLFAVDRQVDGCREVTFVHRNSGTAEPGPPSR